MTHSESYEYDMLRSNIYDTNISELMTNKFKKNN